MFSFIDSYLESEIDPRHATAADTEAPSVASRGNYVRIVRPGEISETKIIDYNRLIDRNFGRLIEPKISNDSYTKFNDQQYHYLSNAKMRKRLFIDVFILFIHI